MALEDLASLCKIFSGWGIWSAVISIDFLFCDLLYADKVTEQEKWISNHMDMHHFAVFTSL